MNKNEAFKSFGVNQRCQRRSWSGRNDQLVVLTIWTDQKEFCKRRKSINQKIQTPILTIGKINLKYLEKRRHILLY